MDYSDYMIYMAFMGSNSDPHCLVQLYDFDYRLQAQISTELSGSMFTDISSCLDQNFLVGSHTGGTISVFNLNTNTSELIVEPFGQVDVIWGVIVFNLKPPGEP